MAFLRARIINVSRSTVEILQRSCSKLRKQVQQAQGCLKTATLAYTYTPGDNNFIYDLLENAHIFYKVAFANESLVCLF